MKKVTVSGKTVEEAVSKGISQLNTTEDRVEVTIIENPQKGFLGFIGAKPAVVDVVVRPDPVEEAHLFLKDVISNMGFSVEVTKSEEKGQVLFSIEGENIGPLIGKHGHTLDSLQYLLNLVANRYSDDYIRITLDAGNYRMKRKESLEQLAQRLAVKALSTKREVRLEPMNAHERKVIHHILQHKSGVKTYSDGEEPQRRVIIAPA
ncbi:RNA-binding cell elongation regulator Jag/EloR [Desertibacillus haloalkaliphilus]|uniref:RNA-binding cell elongation regulator Jag/EloR n=1 Tax=Desertibacillus haloalkaliphilus TaxID=1328930 RepID=UPI001C2721FD|nr:RNA-binding cell elongation regulator Jag/EloR [Desertibacillus haloalkaliphilus]MBU8905761.1 protein jag [Desertibacillus haloalkaliphilus]